MSAVFSLDDALAEDRSLRSIDADGHMRVEESRISKANVCPYLGQEIPEWQSLGLDPDRIYYLYRDPLELAKGASTFDGKPLLIKHVAITGEVPNQSLWVGTLGQCTFEAPYLITRPLMVLTAEAQRLIGSNKQRELSAGYRYDVVMEPGVTNTGARFDARMTNIRGNHVAIVSEGRAGRDVHVADELPRSLKIMPLNIAQIAVDALAAAGVRLTATERLALDERAAEVGDGPDETSQRRLRSVISLDETEKSEAERKALDFKRRRLGKDAELTDEEKADCYDAARDDKAKTWLTRDKSKARDADLPALGNSPDRNRRDAAGMEYVHIKGQPPRSDHRKDFNSLAGGGAKDEALVRSSIAGGYGYAGPRMSAGGVDIDAMFAALHDRDRESALAMDHGGDLLDLDGMFAAPTRN